MSMCLRTSAVVSGIVQNDEHACMHLIINGSLKKVTNLRYSKTFDRLLKPCVYICTKVHAIAN
jgi:hypothetical protein